MTVNSSVVISLKQGFYNKNKIIYRIIMPFKSSLITCMLFKLDICLCQKHVTNIEVNRRNYLTSFNCKTAPAICKSVQWALIQVVVKRK